MSMTITIDTFIISMKLLLHTYTLRPNRVEIKIHLLLVYVSWDAHYVGRTG